MKREVITEGPTVEDAVDAALEDLGVQQDAVEYEVLESPGRRMFGIGGDRLARVKVVVKQEYLDLLHADEIDESAEDESMDEVVVLEGGSTTGLSEEELDRVADAAVEALKTILSKMDIEAEIEEYEGDEGELILDVVGPDLAVLIGRHGRTLDSLQAVVSAITSRTMGFRYPVVVDVEGYRHRRRQKIEEMARRSADRSVRQHGPVRLRPMNAYERRIVHVVLRDDRRVTTASEGEDPFRSVVIKPR